MLQINSPLSLITTEPLHHSNQQWFESLEEVDHYGSMDLMQTFL